MEEVRLKRCSTCKIEKSFEEFSKCKSKTDGCQSHCKVCVKEYRNQNKEKISEQRKEHYEQNKEKILERNKEYREQNREKILERNKEYSKEYYEQNKEKITKQLKEYRNQNKDKRNALTAKRRARKLQARPQWLTPEHFEEITEFYTICKMFQIYTGLTYHVDHIVPLQGKTVCGLHVPWNLQILEASENISKKNKLLQEELDTLMEN